MRNSKIHIQNIIIDSIWLLGVKNKLRINKKDSYMSNSKIRGLHWKAFSICSFHPPSTIMTSDPSNECSSLRTHEINDIDYTTKIIIITREISNMFDKNGRNLSSEIQRKITHIHLKWCVTPTRWSGIICTIISIEVDICKIELHAVGIICWQNSYYFNFIIGARIIHFWIISEKIVFRYYVNRLNLLNLSLIPKLNSLVCFPSRLCLSGLIFWK